MFLLLSQLQCSRLLILMQSGTLEAFSRHRTGFSVYDTHNDGNSILQFGRVPNCVHGEVGYSMSNVMNLCGVKKCPPLGPWHTDGCSKSNHSQMGTQSIKHENLVHLDFLVILNTNKQTKVTKQTGHTYVCTYVRTYIGTR